MTTKDVCEGLRVCRKYRHNGLTISIEFENGYAFVINGVLDNLEVGRYFRHRKCYSLSDLESLKDSYDMEFVIDMFAEEMFAQIAEMEKADKEVDE